MNGEMVLGLIGAFVMLAGSVFVFIKGRGENRNKTAEIKLALDKQIDERVQKALTDAYATNDQLKTVKAELEAQLSGLKDEMRRQGGATRRVLHDVARQWTSPMPPVLHPDDVAALSDTLPAAWRAS